MLEHIKCEYQMEIAYSEEKRLVSNKRIVWNKKPESKFQLIDEKMPKLENGVCFN